MKGRRRGREAGEGGERREKGAMQGKRGQKAKEKGDVRSDHFVQTTALKKPMEKCNGTCSQDKADLKKEKEEEAEAGKAYHHPRHTITLSHITLTYTSHKDGRRRRMIKHEKADNLARISAAS